MKRDKISVRTEYFWSRSPNIKKAKKFWERDWKIWREILTSLFNYFEKGNSKTEFPASRLSNNY